MLTKKGGPSAIGGNKPKKNLFGDDSDNDGGFVKAEEKQKLP
jgi:hypothetical protein